MSLCYVLWLCFKLPSCLIGNTRDTSVMHEQAKFICFINMQPQKVKFKSVLINTKQVEPKWKVANRILATKNTRRVSSVKQIRTVKKVLYAIFYFFTNKGPDIQIPVAKGRTVTGKFYKKKLF